MDFGTVGGSPSHPSHPTDGRSSSLPLPLSLSLSLFPPPTGDKFTSYYVFGWLVDLAAELLACLAMMHRIASITLGIGTGIGIGIYRYRYRYRLLERKGMEKLINLPGLVVISDVSLSRHVSCLACLVGLLVGWDVRGEGMLCYGLITAVFGAVDVGV